MYSVWKLYVCKTGASRLLLCYAWLCIGHSWYSVILPFPLKTHKQISDAHLAVGAKQSGLFGLQEGLICIEKNPLSKQVTRQWEKYGMHLYVTILWGRIFAESFQLFKILSKVEDVFCRSWAKDVMKRCYLCTFSWTPAVISKTKVIFHKYIHYRNT